MEFTAAIVACRVRPCDYIMGLGGHREADRRGATPMTSLSQAYIDESGGLDLPRLVVGGLVGHTEMWRKFAIEWQAELDRYPALPPLHMVDLWGRKNGFEVLQGDCRESRLNALVDVLEKFQPQAFMATVDVEEFRTEAFELMGVKYKRQDWQYPYVFAATHLVGGLTALEESIGMVRSGYIGNTRVRAHG